MFEYFEIVMLILLLCFFLKLVLRKEVSVYVNFTYYVNLKLVYKKGS